MPRVFVYDYDEQETCDICIPCQLAGKVNELGSDTEIERGDDYLHVVLDKGYKCDICNSKLTDINY